MTTSTLKFSLGHQGREDRIIHLFRDTFSASEGPEEGALIGDLVTALFATTPSDDIRTFAAETDGTLIGAGIFTRLTYAEDHRSVWILSPMAIATGHQRQGYGEKLLTHALAALRSGGVDIALTYGDPNYYGRVGFAPITEDQAKAPLRLSAPHGWLGQSLTTAHFAPLKGAPTCVSALNRPDIW